MTERERWIVYPLLFLALGVALRDKFVGTTSRTIRCQELIVEEEANGNEQPREIAKIGHIGTFRSAEGTPIPLPGMTINGVVNVNGLLNAAQYGNILVHPLPILTAPRVVPPVSPLPNQQPGSSAAPQSGGPSAKSTAPAGPATPAAK